MKKEWKEFQVGSIAVPAKLDHQILSKVKTDLEPSHQQVLVKLGFLHMLASLATLSVCPQFGIRLAGEGMGAMQWFMSLGTWGCAAACGTLFISSSLLLASIVLSRAEWRAIRSNSILTLTALVLPSLGFFKIMEGEFFLEFSVAWLLGALISGLVMLEGVWKLKNSPVR